MTPSQSFRFCGWRKQVLRAACLAPEVVVADDLAHSALAGRHAAAQQQQHGQAATGRARVAPAGAQVLEHLEQRLEAALDAEHVGRDLARHRHPRAPPVEHRARLTAAARRADGARVAACAACQGQGAPTLPHTAPRALRSFAKSAAGLPGRGHVWRRLGRRGSRPTPSGMLTRCCLQRAARASKNRFKRQELAGPRGRTGAGAGLVGAVGARAAAAPPRHVLLEALDVGAGRIAGAAGAPRGLSAGQRAHGSHKVSMHGVA